MESFGTTCSRFNRPVASRLIALFELDQRFSSRCFKDALPPSVLAQIEAHLVKESETLFPSSDYRRVVCDCIKAFVTLCSPTDAATQDVAAAAQFLLFVAYIKTLVAEDIQHEQEFFRAFSEALSSPGGEEQPHKLGPKVAELLPQFRACVIKRTEQGYKGSRIQLDRFFCAVANLLPSPPSATNTEKDACGDVSEVPPGASGTEAWVHLWAALGFPSEPFLSHHAEDPSYEQLLRLTAQVASLTREAVHALLQTALPPSPATPTMSRAGPTAPTSHPLLHQQPSPVPLPHTEPKQSPLLGTRSDVINEVMRRYNVGHTEALGLVTSMIEHKVDAFFELAGTLDLTEGDAMWYIELLKKVMRGNWFYEARYLYPPTK